MIPCEHTAPVSLERDCDAPATHVFMLMGRPTAACAEHLPEWAADVEVIEQ